MNRRIILPLLAVLAATPPVLRADDAADARARFEKLMEEAGRPTKPPTPAPHTTVDLTPAPRDPATPAPANDAPIPAEPLNIPQDAQFTIVCTSVTGPNHAGRARAFKTQLAQQTGMKDWYIVSCLTETSIYHGFYRVIREQRDMSREDRHECARALEDRKKIAALTDSNGLALFRLPLLVSLDDAAPSGPPEWNIQHTKGYWSLQIAAFKDRPDRKQCAVTTVAELRKDGYDAYYYHGSMVSSVCIGTWPEASVRREDAVVKANSRNTASTPVVLWPGSVPLPKNKDHPDEFYIEGQRATVIQPKLTVLDPAVQNTIRLFPTHAINGEIGKKFVTGGKEIEKLNPSFLVVIPRARPADAGAQAGRPDAPSVNAANDPWQVLRTIQQNSSSAGGTGSAGSSKPGSLKGFDDK